MNAKKVQNFVLAYIEATGCQLIEKSPGHVTVKLSPAADRALSGRPFYWSFIDSTGTPPETLTYTWMFEKSPPPEPGAKSTPLSSLMSAGGRTIREQMYFGSRRLAQLFDAVREAGRCTMMFEEAPRNRRTPLESTPYTAWLGVNFKVAYVCDMKREALHEWGISLATGNIDEMFGRRLAGTRLTPRLPPNVHLLRNGLSLRKGLSQLEQALERKLKAQNFDWAIEAEQRRQEEQERIAQYYGPKLSRAAEDPEQTAALNARLAQRQDEIDWQYRPRIEVSVLSCGLFHLAGLD
jgi:hypothetical protein